MARPVYNKQTNEQAYKTYGKRPRRYEIHTNMDIKGVGIEVVDFLHSDLKNTI
jgi:hypothetical protein